MRTWGLVHLPAGLALLLALLLLAAVAWYAWTSRSPGLTPKLAGTVPVLPGDLPAAWLQQESLREALAQDPDHAEDILREHNSAGTPDTPLTWQEQLLVARYRHDSGAVVTALHDGMAEAQQAGRPGQALELAGLALREALRYNLEPAVLADCYAQRAWQAESAGLYRSALQDFQEQERQLRRVANGDGELSICIESQFQVSAFMLGEYDTALGLYPAWRESASLQNAEADEHIAFYSPIWARAYRDWGQPADAYALLHSLVQPALRNTDPQRADAAVPVADLLADLGHLSEANQLYRHVLALRVMDGTDVPAAFYVQPFHQLLLSQGREEEAALLLEDVRRKLDAASRSLGKSAGGSPAAAESAMWLRVAQAWLYNNEALAQFEAGMYKEARTTYEQALQATVNDTVAAKYNPARLGLIKVQFQLGEYEAASQGLEALIAQARQAPRQPSSLELARLWLLRARIETGRGRLATAQRDLDWVAQVLRHVPATFWADQRELLLAQGELAQARGDTALALKRYRAAFDAALAEARALSYSGSLRLDYAAELRRALARLAPLLEASGGQAELEHRNAQVTAAIQLRAIALGRYAAPSPAARECLERYRAAQTRAQTLAGRDGQTLADCDPGLKGWWHVVQRDQGAERKLWLDVWREMRQLHNSFGPRSAEQRAAAAQALHELKQLDPQTAALLAD